jgi:ABC-2 type transport system ATP-binding protein
MEVSMKNSPIISVDQFSMSFGDKQVVKDVSFIVNRGDIFGFLGANGSGKTTTIRALLGIYRPTSGTLLINGTSFSPSMGISLGYLPEERGLYKKESVIDTMVYFGMLKNMERHDARQWSLDYLARVDLADKSQTRLDKLSGGQQQKVQLGVTIMNNPDLLILDEPTKGFDPVNRRLMMDIVHELTRQGTTVVLVTHQMEEVERLCNRMMLLKDGQRRLYGNISDIKQEFGSQVVALDYSGRLEADKKLFSISEQSVNSAVLTPMDGVDPQRILSSLTKQQNLKIQRFQIEQSSLDDIFVQIYQEGAK